jgi:hypothetical protein
MARDSPEITKVAMESTLGVRTPISRVNEVGLQHMTTTTETDSYGLLGTLSPEMARDLGDAFSLQKIGASGTSRPRRDKDSTRREALRFASRAAAFVMVSAFVVLLTATALYLMRL